MATNQALLAQIVSDFDVLYHAYDRAGLLAEDAQTEAAQKLLGSGEDIYRFTRAFLLTEALIRNRVGRVVHGGGGLRHLAVFGGNNVGKSTVINILAGEQVASTSPEGGHTRHAQAVCAFSVPGSVPHLFGDNPYAFCRFHPVAVSALDPKRLDQYGIGSRCADVLPHDVVLWDMPDCDATGSGEYMPAVVETLTAADTLVYVTSVDKFAESHPVEWVFRLHAAGIDFVECLNKTPRKDQQVVITNQRTIHFPKMAEKIAKELTTPVPDPPIVGLRFLTDGEEADLWGPCHPEAGQLRNTVLRMLASADPAQASAKALTFVARSLNRVLEPARMEVLAKEQWATAVEAAVKDFVAAYEQQYLQSDKVIEPFSRLNLEILRLLDPNIPGLKEALRAIRWIMRWPARLILAIGKWLFRIGQPGSTDEADKLPPELKAYAEAHTSVLNRLGGRIDSASKEPRHHPFWDALSAAWEQELEQLSTQFGERIKQHMAETDRAIKQAASEIYRQMQQRPVLLRALQGVRVTADVVGALVGFLLPDGGTVYDLLEELVLTPAILAGVEATARLAVETFVNNRKKQLVEKLQRDARTIADQLYRGPLLRMADVAMQQTGTLGVSKELLERLPSTLTQLHAQLAAPAPSLGVQEDTHATTCTAR